MSELDDAVNAANVDRPTYLTALEELAALRARVLELERKEAPGTLPAADIRRAFVAGAKWWDYKGVGASMWQSDQREAEAEAEKRYPAGDVPPKTCSTCCHFVTGTNDSYCANENTPVLEIIAPDSFGCIHHAPRPEAAP